MPLKKFKLSKPSYRNTSTVWCDLKCSYKVLCNLKRSNLHSSMVRFKENVLCVIIVTVRTIYIPVWFDLKYKCSNLSFKRLYIYIPVWFDLKLEALRKRIDEIRNLHSSMVRFKGILKSLSIKMKNYLHSSMVRFKVC